MANLHEKIQQRLQSLSSQVLLEFLHSCADAICGKRGQLYSNFKSSTNWSSEEYEETQLKVKHLICYAVAHDVPKETLLQEVCELDTNHQQCVLNCLEVRKNDINLALQQRTIAISGPVLQDFDWKLKWIMGSSKLSSLKEPLLTVDLQLGERKRTDCTTNTLRTVSLELDRNELKTMLAALEKAQECITNWQT